MGYCNAWQVNVAALYAAMIAVTGCTRYEEAYGQTMIVIDSDVPVRSAAMADAEFDRVQVEVTSNGVVLRNRDWIYPTTPLTFPQTIALVNQGEQRSGPVRVSLLATRDGKVTFMQERQLEVPADTTTWTTMRFDWLCRGVASTVNSKPDSGCPSGQSCRFGSCVPAEANGADVSLSAPNAACFATQACFADAEAIASKLDATCSFSLSPGDVAAPGMLNVALEPVPGQGGLCEGQARCLVALPYGEGQGFTVTGGQAKLAARVCELLAQGDVAQVWLSRGCNQRLPAQSLCSPWLTPVAM